MKPSFQTEWLALPSKESHQILKKITFLTEDPYPDGMEKKQLVHINPKLHRIRSGDYRIFYTFDKQYVSLLALRRRKEDTYAEDYSAEFLGGLDTTLDADFDAIPTTTLPAIPALPIAQKKPLPETITKDLLISLQVPSEFHAQLLAINTEEELLSCLKIPSLYLEKLIEYLFPQSFEQVLEQPDYVLHDIDDLLRFKEGKLLDFLLRLSPEQERVANWSMNVTGPTQVKGNPGTGKSTVALYRIRSLIQNLSKMNEFVPHILYTTYTNALVKSSNQLLQQLLGNESTYVVVKTADKLVWELLDPQKRPFHIAADGDIIYYIRNIIEQMQNEGNVEQLKVLKRLSPEYLHEEICQIIIARQITTLEAYQEMSREGRKHRLDKNERKSVWKIYESLLQKLKRRKEVTWQEVRLIAEDCYHNNSHIRPFDAVVVDEAQDLDPSVLRVLVGLCKAPNRFFITADANQSIYRSGFSWTDVHESLKFQGRRTSVLKTNYRSTRQICEAAQSYLANEALETEVTDNLYLYSGPKPLIRTIQNNKEEIQLLSSFLPIAARECRLLLSSCAVLCPSASTGIIIAGELSKLGVKAKFMKREEVDLEYTGVKVMTIHSSKGLEFPIVAMAGFIGSRFDKALELNTDDGREEILARNRRIIFVGMTRAMRVLLVIIPEQTRSPLLTGFDPNYWNLSNNNQYLN